MSSVEKFIGESQLKSTPTKKFTFIIDEKKVTTAKIADNAITEEKISGEDTPEGAAVTTSKIKDGAVTNPKIANGAVTTIKIQDFDAESSFPTGVTNEKLADESVTESKLASKAVTEGKIAPNAVTAGKIADDAVIAGNIAAGAVTHDNLTEECVQADNIAPNAVENDNIANNAVTSGKIAANAVTTEKLSGYIDDQGVTHDAAVTNAKIANNAVTTAKIGDGEVQENHLAPGAVTTAKLADGMIEQLQTITDAEPTTGSVKPINSGGVLSHGSAFDVSEYNKSEGVLATYETLSAALNAVPATSQRGGMSIKFIQLTPATYSVVKTEGLTEKPAGTEVEQALAITDDIYTAAQLPVEAPVTTATYWMAVTETVEDVETTTYTIWVITKVTADKTEYVQYRLMSTAWSTIAENWKSLADESKRLELIANTKVGSIGMTFADRCGRPSVNLQKIYIASTGIITSSTSTNYRLSYTGLLQKGTIIHYTAKALIDNGVIRVGFMQTDPASLDTLVGAVVSDIITIHVNKSNNPNIDIYFEVPYDAYLLYSHYSTNLYNVAFTSYVPSEEKMVDNLPTKDSKNLVESDGVSKAIAKGSRFIYFVGGNTNYVSSEKTVVIPGHTYRIYLVSTDWDIPTLPGTNMIFGVDYIYNDEPVNVVRVNYNEIAAIEPFYDIKISDEVIGNCFMRIAGRAVSGVEVGTIIEDITEQIYNNARIDDVEKNTYVDESFNLRNWPDTTPNATITTGYINDKNVFLENSAYTCALITIKPGEKYIVESAQESWCIYAILSSFDNRKAVLSSYYPTRLSVSGGNSTVFTAPSDGFILYATLARNNKTELLKPEVYHIVSVKDTIKDFKTDGVKYTDDTVVRLADSIGNKLRPISFVTDDNGNIIPQTVQERDSQRRARQLMNLEFTTKRAMPCNNQTVYDGTGEFPAGTTIKGAPYSSVKELDKYIGYDVSIHTFMTAVNNPYSLLYTEKVLGTKSRSIWGKTYHGTNCALYMGTVCSTFAGYGAGLFTPWDTGLNKWMNERAYYLSKNYDQSAQGLNIGDIYWESGHNCLITGLKANANGIITSVQLSQSAGNHVVVNWLGSDYFDSYVKYRKAIMYRNIQMYKMPKYVPSPFVLDDDENLYNIGDIVFIESYSSVDYYICTVANRDNSFDASKWTLVEEYDSTKSYSVGNYCTRTEDGVKRLYRRRYYSGSASDWSNYFELVKCLPWNPYPFVYNNDICTFHGDRAAFREGDLVVLNYNLNDSNSAWTSIEVFKDDVLYNTYSLASIDQSSLPEGQREHALNLGTELSYGSYKARLTDGVNYSGFTYWEIIETNVNFYANIDGHKSKIAWSSANAKVVAINVVYMPTGWKKIIIEPTADDIKNGYILKDLVAIRETISKVSPLVVTDAIKVVFEGDYGRVTNEPITIESLMIGGNYNNDDGDEEINPDS